MGCISLCVVFYVSDCLFFLNYVFLCYHVLVAVFIYPAAFMVAVLNKRITKSQSPVVLWAGD